MRTLLRRLPDGHRGKSTWQVVANQRQAAGAARDLAELGITLRFVLFLEHVECRYLDNSLGVNRFVRKAAVSAAPCPHLEKKWRTPVTLSRYRGRMKRDLSHVGSSPNRPGYQFFTAGTSSSDFQGASNSF